MPSTEEHTIMQRSENKMPTDFPKATVSPPTTNTTTNAKTETNASGNENGNTVIEKGGGVKQQGQQQPTPLSASNPNTLTLPSNPKPPLAKKGPNTSTAAPAIPAGQPVNARAAHVSRARENFGSSTPEFKSKCQALLNQLSTCEDIQKEYLYATVSVAICRKRLSRERAARRFLPPN